MCTHKHLRMMTSDPNTASILSANANFEIFMAGGLVWRRDCDIIEKATIDFIRQFKVDDGSIRIAPNFAEIDRWTTRRQS